MDSSPRSLVGPSKGKGKKSQDDQPKRPLSAYNIFFQVERQRLINDRADAGTYSRAEVYSICLDKETRIEKSKRPHRKIHGMISFTDLAKTIAQKWKDLDSSDKVLFEERADEEKRKYAMELEEWLLHQVPTQQVKKRLSALRRGSLSKYITHSRSASPPSTVHPVSQDQSPVNSVVHRPSPVGVMGSGSGKALSSGRKQVQLDRARNLERLYKMQMQLYNEQMKLQAQYQTDETAQLVLPMAPEQASPQSHPFRNGCDSPGYVSTNNALQWAQSLDTNFVDSHVQQQLAQERYMHHAGQAHIQQHLLQGDREAWLQHDQPSYLPLNRAHVQAHSPELQHHLDEVPLEPFHHIDPDFP